MQNKHLHRSTQPFLRGSFYSLLTMLELGLTSRPRPAGPKAVCFQQDSKLEKSTCFSDQEEKACHLIHHLKVLIAPKKTFMYVVFISTFTDIL